MAVFSAISSAIGGKKAAKKAAAGMQQGIDYSQQMYDTGMGLAAPYLSVGGNAMGALADIYGLGLDPRFSYGAANKYFSGAGGGDNRTVEERQQAALDRFMASPGYQFRFNEGLRALDASAASRGMALSGRQVKAAQEYGQGAASSEWGNYISGLRHLAGIGTASTANAQQLGLNTANSVSRLLAGKGQALGSAAAAPWNAAASGFQTLGQLGMMAAGGGFSGPGALFSGGGGSGNLMTPGQTHFLQSAGAY